MSSFVYNLGLYEPPNFSEHIEEFGLFFDGTGNNRLNVDARKLVRLQPYVEKEHQFSSKNYTQKVQGDKTINVSGALNETHP